MKKINPEQVPHFNNFQEFCVWYTSSGPWVLYPNGVCSTINIDTYSTETIVFRHLNYQVEMYVIKNFNIKQHTHRLCNTFEWMVSPYSSNPTHEFIINSIKPRGTPHGGKKSNLNSLPSHILFVLQDWTPYKPLGHISLKDYLGVPLSANHEQLLMEYSPSSLTKLADGNTWVDTALNGTQTETVINLP